MPIDMYTSKMNLVDEKFGRLLVIAKSSRRTNDNKIMWDCVCDCGVHVTIRTSDLKSGNTTSCGCWRKEHVSATSKIDLRGKRFGRLLVIKEDGVSNNGHCIWLCKCICGKFVSVQGTHLQRGNTMSCGCYNKERISLANSVDIVGRKFGRLTVIKQVGKDKWGKYRWLCECACGKTMVVIGADMRADKTRSCGCLQKETVSKLLRQRFDEGKYAHKISKSATLFLDSLELVVGHSIQREFPLDYRLFDGQLRKVLIEVDCDYWHGFAKAKQVDKLKNEIARRNGYKLFRFTVNSITEVPERLRQYQAEFRKLKEVV